MLKMLRFDFYKIFKSKALLSVFIVTLGLAILDPLILFDKTDYSILPSLFYWNCLGFLPITFVVPFVSKDFSSKYIKNVYSSYSFADKIYYILSKVVYIFAMCVIWFLLRFASHSIFTLIRSAAADEKIVFVFVDLLNHPNATLNEFVSNGLFYYFSQMMGCFAEGMLCMFLCVLLKKEYIVIIVVVLYWFVLSGLVYGLIGDTANYFKDNLSIFGMVGGIIGSILQLSMWEITQRVLACLGYSASFTVLGWLSFFKRSY